ncbi:MAG: carbohydrate-binding domain-containing protein [Bacteroidaceae bacterium]|nr:carbohydrate-binding domain-containing protein [Bacteroidaceae bacterium]
MKFMILSQVNKKIYALVAVLLLTVAATAQTLNVHVGNVTYQFPASRCGEMTYTGGTTLTILNKAFTLSDISSITVDDTEVTDNLVQVAYSGTSATVTVAGNVAQYVEPTVSGAYVSIAQSNTEAIDNDEITYQLSGTTTNGQFALSGSYKCTVMLAGVNLTCSSDAAINITNSKRIQISAKKETSNTLTDGANGSQKACLYSKGQLQLQGNGTLTVVGKTKHGIKSGDYITLKNLTLNITSAVGDGISCNEYFQMKSGTVTIKGVGDDGIQCDLDGDTSTGETDAHDDEDSGNIYLEGGTLTVTTTAAASKGVKAAGDMRVSNGEINVTTTGNGTYDSEEKDAKGCAGLDADGDMTINGGTLTLKSSGTGGKGIKADGTLTINGGTVNATASGSNYSYSSYSASAKAIKAGTRTEVASVQAYESGVPEGPGGPGGPGGHNNKNYTYSGGIVINGGTIIAIAKSHEAIESKSTIEITDGYIYAESSDDAINSASDFTISGGYVMGNSSGNDGLDANGNFYIKGGNIFAVASRQPEVGIDANTEGGFKLYITGGNVAAIGGLENGSSLSGVTSKSSSYSKGSWYSFKSGSTTKFYFKVPSNSSMGSSMTIVSSSSPSVSTASSVTSNIWNGYGKTD